MINKKGLADKILDLPPEYLYAFTFILLFLSMSLPAITTKSMNPYISNTYEWVSENIEPGDIVIFELGNAYAYYISHLPGVTALLNHIFDTAGAKGGNVKLVVFGTGTEHMMIWTYAQQPLVLETMKRWGYDYGKDWIHLGILPGGDTGYYVLAKNPYVGEVDYYEGRSLIEFDIMKDFTDINDVKLWIYAMWNPMPHIRQISGPYETPYIIIGHPAAAVDHPIWVDAGQMTGFIHGWPGAAMYETLTGKPGLAALGSLTISTAYLIIIGSIILCNILYVSKRFGGG